MLFFDLIFVKKVFYLYFTINKNKFSQLKQVIITGTMFCICVVVAW